MEEKHKCNCKNGDEKLYATTESRMNGEEQQWFKKGDRKEIDNYRGINLLNTTLKLRARITTNKISEKI